MNTEALITWGHGAKEYKRDTGKNPLIIGLTRTNKVKFVHYTEDFKLWREKRAKNTVEDRQAGNCQVTDCPDYDCCFQTTFSACYIPPATQHKPLH